MGVGKLLFAAACGVDEGVGVGASDELVELQAVITNNPNKLIKRIVNIFFMVVIGKLINGGICL
jgi:hypothetical protein